MPNRLALCFVLAAIAHAGPALALPIQFPQFDLEATGMEVVQSIQNEGNDVPLVAGKPTWVRVYARHFAAPELIFNPYVKTRLAASRIAPGPVTFLGVLDQSAFVPDQVGLPRLSIGNSANFAIPASWRSGTVQFAAIVDWEEKYAESDDANNTIIETVTFDAVPPVRLRVYSVDYPGGSLPTGNDLGLLNSWLRRAFPTGALDVEYRSAFSTVDVTNDTCNCPRACTTTMPQPTCSMNMMAACFDDTQCPMGQTCNCPKGGCIQTGTCLNMPPMPGFPCSSSLDCGCGRVNDWLTTQRNLDMGNDPGFDPDRRYVALVHDSGGFMRGCSPGVERKVASGPTGDPDSQDFTGWDTDASYGDWYTGHELGHAYGLQHWTCCGATADIAKVPYGQCALTSGDEHIGVDLGIPALYRGNQFTDLMAYCDFQWTSDITYTDILAQLVAEGGAPPPPPPPPSDKLLVQGSANLALGTAFLRSVLSLPSFAAAPTGGSVGSWEIRLEDASGGITSHFFDPDLYEDDQNFRPDDGQRMGGMEAMASIAEVVERPPGALVRLDLFEGGSLRDTRLVSANPPTVTLAFPNGGETLSSVPTTVTWTAADLDGDALEATLLYSTDAGASWKSVAAGIVGSSADIDPTTLAGSAQVLFRVLVSDGFHTASDDSDAVLTIPDSPPRVFVASPVDGSLRAAGEAVAFEAAASDPEDGMLTGTALAWSSDRQGALGAGESLLVEALAPGTHVVTVEATDSEGQTASGSVTVVVGPASADACPAEPQAACDDMGVALLRYRDSSTPERRTLSVVLKRSEADHAVADFGTPGAPTAHTLCFYEDGLLRSSFALPSSTPWTPLGDRGFKFLGSGGDAVRRAVLRASMDGRPNSASAIVRARGASLPDLDPPVAVPLVVQLVNDTTPVCLSGTWDALRRNETALLQSGR